MPNLHTHTSMFSCICCGPGVYLLRDNVLAVAITPSRRIKVFLSLPINSDRTSGTDVNLSTSSRLLKTDFIDVDQITSSSVGIDISEEINYSTTDVFGSTLDYLGYGLKKLNNVRRIINFAIRWERVKIDVASNVVADRVQFSTGQNEIPTSLQGNTSNRTRRVLHRQITLNNNSLLLNSLIPQLTLSESTKQSMTLLSSVPVGTSDLQLVTARLGASAAPSSTTAVGLGDDIIPASFKAMQMQLGSTLDSVCPSSTSLRMSRLGDLVKGPSSSRGLLVRKVNLSRWALRLCSLIVIS